MFISTSFVLGVLFLKHWKSFDVSSHLHPLQHWWKILDFKFPPAKADCNGGIDTYCCTFDIITNVLIMINLEDLTVKSVTLSKIKFINHRNSRITLTWEACFWTGKHVIFVVADSIWLPDCIFLRHLSLDAYFLRSKSFLMCQHNSTLFRTGGKWCISHFFSLKLIVVVEFSNIVAPFT